jgi:hypothetical protein
MEEWKMRFINYTFLAVALLALTAQGSLSQAQSPSISADLKNLRGAGSTSGPSVGGDVNIDVDAGNVTVRATGDSTAAARIGALTGGAVGGDVDIGVEVEDVKVSAEGGSCAEALIGAMGAPACSGN